MEGYKRTRDYLSWFLRKSKLISYQARREDNSGNNSYIPSVIICSNYDIIININYDSHAEQNSISGLISFKTKAGEPSVLGLILGIKTRRDVEEYFSAILPVS